MRVLGGYLASVAVAAVVFLLTDAAQRMAEPPVASPAEPALPFDWISVVIALVMAMLLVTVFALPAFLVCLAASVRTGIQHPAIHVACGVAIGSALGRLFAGLVDRPVPAALAGAVGGGVYWWLAVRERGRSGPGAATADGNGTS